MNMLAPLNFYHNGQESHNVIIAIDENENKWVIVLVVPRQKIPVFF